MRLINGPDGKPKWIELTCTEEPLPGCLVLASLANLSLCPAVYDDDSFGTAVYLYGRLWHTVTEPYDEIVNLLASTGESTGGDSASLVQFVSLLKQEFADSAEHYLAQSRNATPPMLECYASVAEFCRGLHHQCRTALEAATVATPGGDNADLVKWAKEVIATSEENVAQLRGEASGTLSDVLRPNTEAELVDELQQHADAGRAAIGKARGTNG